MNPMEAKKLAGDWIDAWNRHDLKAILSHYAHDVEFRSPFVEKILGDSSKTVKGIKKLKSYFAEGLKSFPDLHFKLMEVSTSCGSVILYYHSVKGLIAAERMIFNPEGKISKVTVDYENAA